MLQGEIALSIILLSSPPLPLQTLSKHVRRYIVLAPNNHSRKPTHPQPTVCTLLFLQQASINLTPGQCPLDLFQLPPPVAGLFSRLFSRGFSMCLSLSFVLSPVRARDACTPMAAVAKSARKTPFQNLGACSAVKLKAPTPATSMFSPVRPSGGGTGRGGRSARPKVSATLIGR